MEKTSAMATPLWYKTLSEFYQNADGLWKILFLLAFTLLTYFVMKLVVFAITRTIKNASIKATKFTPLMCAFTSKVIKVLGWIFAILVILQIWGINLAPVIAGLGVTGIVLGFALQESISSFFSGFMLVLNNPFGLGDYVDIGSVSGTVTGMDMLSVTLVTPDNKRITMSNKIVWGDTIVNYSAMDKRRIDMVVAVDYNSNIELAREVIRDLITSYPDVIKEPAPVVEVGELAGSSINLVVRPWVGNSDFWKVKWRFQKDVVETLDKAGIEIPYNKLDINVLSNKASI